eukprot:TRINITY_DN29186_c0_g2_i1.p1 TRINITY_DN29186_c0_g2~~TRINITY_DN29186_c0_g2_i1.p1  ORF type:complete len:437 (-),score=103.72 TRINITY_DN29186_c0_g2_i1:100-1410(-)
MSLPVARPLLVEPSAKRLRAAAPEPCLPFGMMQDSATPSSASSSLHQAPKAAHEARMAARPCSLLDKIHKDPCSDLSERFWREAKHLLVKLCRLSAGPTTARHLAAVSSVLGRAVAEAWGDIRRQWPQRLYAIGGLGAHFEELASGERYDSELGKWEALPELCHPCSGAAASMVGGRLYIVGGEADGLALRGMHRFDPHLGRWERLPPMRQARVRASAFGHGGSLYVFGGLDGGEALASAERYRPDLLRWEALPAMHRRRYGSACCVWAGGICVVGGEFVEAGMLTSVECFSPEAHAWQLLPSLKAPAVGASIGVAAGCVLSLGGLAMSGQAQGYCERLCFGKLAEQKKAASKGQEPEAATFQVQADWEVAAPMSSARQLASVASFLDGVAAVGGKGPTFEATAFVERFDAATGLWQVLPAMTAPRLRAAVAGGLL